MAEGKAFDYQTPNKAVTNPEDPQGLAGAVYPKHLHKYVPIEKAQDKDGKLVHKSAVAIAWDGETPIYNEYVVVANADEEAGAIDKGYSLTPVLKAPKK